MQPRSGHQCWLIRRILELWDKQGMELFLDFFTTSDLFLFFLLYFFLSPLPKWGKKGTAVGSAMCGGNGPRIEEPGDSDQADMEDGDQGHGLGTWVYHWVHGTGHKALGLNIGH